MGNPISAIPSTRVHAIDWLRGLSVLLMIECHSLVFLRLDLEKSDFWLNLQNINGLVSTAFLFASGFASGLVGSRAAKDSAARRRRARRTFLRLAEVLAIAMYFHFCTLPIFARPATLLKVDILTCIAYGVVATWGVITLCRGRHGLAAGTLLAGSVAVLVLTPWAATYRGNEIVTSLLNNTDFNGASSMFPLMPWLAYPLLGAAEGVLTANPAAGRRRLMIAMASLAVVCLLLTHTPPGRAFWGRFDRDRIFWTLNAVQRLWKIGVVCVALLVIERLAVLAENKPIAGVFRPVRRTVDYFSSHALTAYLVHLSLIYGFLGFSFTRTWIHACNWGQYAWRLLLIISLTAGICFVGRKLRQAIETELARQWATGAASEATARG